jgi:hypothetical protein
MRTLQTFVVRILHRTEFGSEFHGQISEPSSADEWRATFSDVQELLDQLKNRLAVPPDEPETARVVSPIDAYPD